MARDVKGYLNQLLQMYWLRPETALWRCFDCLLMDHVPITGNSIDLGCGDGILSYIIAGGQIHNYDVFLDVEQLQDYNNGADIYNSSTCRQLESDETFLRHRFSYGVDHKTGLIEKAKRLGGFYDRTMVHDLNLPLPFPESHFDTAFSNILYWLNDLNDVLSDWNRVLKRSGRLILFVPNENFRERAWLYYSAPHQGDNKYLNFFDRGYAGLVQHCYSSARWLELFVKNGFKVVKHRSYVTDPVISIWNIGTRPIASLLISMANKLSVDDRRLVKCEWVEYFEKFCLPIVEGECNREPEDSAAAFHFYVLEKQGCA